MLRQLAVRVSSAILVALLMVLALAGPAAAAKPFQENIDTTVDEVVCGIPRTPMSSAASGPTSSTT